MVLEKIKIISYKDLKEVRAKRAIKEKAIVDKGRGKRGRKYKSPTLEEDSLVLIDNKVLELVKALVL